MQNTVILGITGERFVGKSTAIEYLRGRYHFATGHPFNVGKEMLITYYKYIGIEPHIAHRMVYGDLKDVPCDKLPNGVASRHFMEEMGNFLGVKMGPDWTAGAEVMKMGMHQRMVIDSVVYESSWLRSIHPHAKVVRIIGPDRLPNGKVVAHHTSAAQAAVEVDLEIYNLGTKQELHESIDAMLLQLFPNDFTDSR